MWSALALRQRQSDALITLVWIFCHCLLCQARQKTLRLVGLLVPSIFTLTMISVASLGEPEQLSAAGKASLAERGEAS